MRTVEEAYYWMLKARDIREALSYGVEREAGQGRLFRVKVCKVLLRR